MITLSSYFLLFIFDGFGLFSEINYFPLVLVSFLPIVGFFESIIFDKKLIIPKKIFFLFLLFFVFMFSSFNFSVDQINSYFPFIFYLSSFFIFIFSYNEKRFLESSLKTFLIFSSLIFISISLVVGKNPPISSLQFIYPTYSNHNHLGDFLGLAIVYLFIDYLDKKKKIDLFLILFFFAFFLFSWSRTAYLGLFISLFLILIFKKNSRSRITKSIFALILIFFIISQREFYQISQLNFLENFLYQNFQFRPRSVFSGRIEYFHQAIQGFLEKPLLGWGPGNFTYLSKKYVSQNLQQVSSSLNIFLTILAEGGVFVFFLFVLLISVIISSYVKNRHKPYDKYFFMFLYLMINFFFDYTYAIKTFFLFWFVVGGLIYQEKQHFKEVVFQISSIITLVIVILYLTGQIFLFTNYYSRSYLFFPFQQVAYQKEINQLIFQNQLKKSEEIAKKYLQLSSFYNFETISFFVDYYQKINQEKKALAALRFYLKNNRYPSLDMLKKYYFLQKKLDGKKSADKEFLSFTKILIDGTWFNPLVEKEIHRFCFDNNIPFCRYPYLYLPKSKSFEQTKVDPYRAVYHFNNLGSHNQSNYPVKKPKNTFRILVLGDSHAFGFLVNTKDSWPERLTDLLNQEPGQNSNKKIEIINLSYHNYDLLYQVERYLIDGKKLKPDLIIWMNNNFYRLHEYFAPILEKYYSYDQEPTRTEYQKKGIYFPSWQLASEEYYKQINKKEVFQKQKEAIREFFENYQGPVVFLSLEEIPQEIKESLLSSSQVVVYELKEIKEDKNNFYPQIGSLNPQGHQKIAEVIKTIVVRYIDY